MPTTAKKHFDEDFARSRKFLGHATALQATDADGAADQARAAVVFAVGALDAYLCDAYVDTLARTLKACRRDKKALPSGYAKESLPAGPLFAAHYTSRHDWALRMAARKHMEKDNLLQVSRVRDLLNPALPAGKKLWVEIIDKYAALGRKRLTRHTATDLAALTGKPLAEAKKEAASALLQRVGAIVQRRHDIAHNCDRPKYKPQSLTAAQAKKMLDDVESFVDVLDAHLDAERQY
jgi:hypothetical protein